MKPLRLLLIVGLLAAGLAGAVVGVRYAYYRIAAAYWRGQIETMPENGADDVLARVAALGDSGLDVVVEALGSPRGPIADASLSVLLERLAGWQESPTAESCRLQARLARSLAERIGDFEPKGRERAARLAARILLWLPPEKAIDRATVIADCGRVLRAAGPSRSVPPPEPFTEELAASFSGGGPGPGFAPERELTGTLEPSLAELGRRDPDRWTPEPSVPVVVPPEPRIGGGVDGDSAARRLPPPPSSPPVDPPTNEPPHPPTNPNSDETPGVASVGDSPGKPDTEPPGAVEPAPPGTEPPRLSDAGGGQVKEPTGAGASPSPLPAEVHDDAEPLGAGDLATAQTVELMRRLQEPSAAASARTELVRRGFTPVHIELAERLFDPKIESRVQLVRLLPRLGSVDADPWLWQLARDPEVRVRAEAIAALATSGHPALLERLERLAREDPSPQIRGQAAQIARIRESRLR
jgi:hypothetical protein